MSWAYDRAHQDLSATGSYSSGSALAKEYAGLEEDGGSRVDDGEGWREIKRDNPPKNAEEYAELVKDYAAQGFDVKAIDMDGDDFTHSNIAIKPKGEQSKTISADYDEMSPEYAEAKARTEQYKEDSLSGRTSRAIFEGGAGNDTSSFLERYRLKLGQRLANGNYRPPKIKDTDTEPAE